MWYNDERPECGKHSGRSNTQPWKVGPSMSKNYSTYQGLIDNEKWLSCPGWPGYEVSDIGRVRSSWGAGKTKGVGRGSRSIGCDWWILSLGTNGSGHKQVSLTRDGKTKTVRVHQLVIEAFVGPCPKGLEVCHKDGNPANNVLSNLRYGTPRSNQIDRLKHKGNPLVKLTPEKVSTIRNRLLSGEKGYKLAKEYNVSPATISMIRNEKIWTPSDLNVLAQS